MRNFLFSKKAFTIIELLIVVSIIGLIAAMSISPYANYLKKSRDERRRTDFEQIRAALELYRSNNANSSYPNATNYTTPNGTYSFTPTYMRTVLKDPRTKQNYIYTATPSGCSPDPALLNPCKEYVVSVALESKTATLNVSPSGSYEN